MHILIALIRKMIEFNDTFEDLRIKKESSVKYLISCTVLAYEHDPSEGGGCIDLNQIQIAYPVIEDDIIDQFRPTAKNFDPIEFIP